MDPTVRINVLFGSLRSLGAYKGPLEPTAQCHLTDFYLSFAGILWSQSH
jgi:hypothetical protein